MKIIRWKYAAPLAVIVVALVLFFVLAFDPILTWSIEKIGSRVNGAKVEVSGLHTKFFKGRLAIGRLQVANAKEPMQNLVEAGPLAFQINPAELIKKRVVINDATLAGLGFNTPRKTSGAIPSLARKESKEPGAASTIVDKYKDRFKVSLDGLKQDVRAKIQFDPKDLTIVKQGDELQQKAATLPDRWKTRVDQLNVDERLKKAEADLQAIKNTPTKGPAALKAVPESLKKLKQTRDELNQIKDDIQKAKNDFASESGSLKSGVQGLQDAKRKDTDNILSRLKLDFADPQRLLEGIIGPAILSKYHTLLSYAQKAKSYMPSKSEKAAPPKPVRAHGIDVEFPTPAAPPKFWLMHAALNGAYEGIEAAGALNQVSTDPSRVGKPMTLDLKGQRAAQRFLVQAVVDHVTDVKKDRFVFDGDGLPLKDLLSDGPLGAALKAGAGNAHLALDLVEGGPLNGQINFKMRSVKLDEAVFLQQLGVTESAAPAPGDTKLGAASGDALKVGFAKNLVQAIEASPEIGIDAQLGGTWENPEIKIGSNLSGVFAGVIKKSAGDVIGKQRAQLEAELDKIVKEKSGAVNEKISQAESQVNGRLGQLQTRVQEKIKDAAGINLGGGEGGSPIPGVKVPSLKGLFNKK